ncbi:flagellin [Marinobacter sp. MMG032]|uniref:Flagellin n=1 Tax=Marinobacter sp. MMG032 TaxID=3158548 RepID=A0AAU7MLC3_9GAMM
MALGINTNVASLSAQNQLQKSQDLSNQALERLSSGLRINSAKDDAAGLAISTRFSAQISGLNVAQRNANDGISYAQTAEGALGEVTNALSRIRDLAVQSANDTNSASDRQALNQEVEALVAEVNRIAGSTQFNGQNILNGNLSELNFQVGANQGQVIQVEGLNSTGDQLGARVSTSASIAGSDIASISGLVIEGTDIDTSSATSSADVVDAINTKGGETGVTASLANEVKTGDIAGDLTSGASDADGEITINGVKIVVADGGNSDTTVDLVQTAANINALSDKTGVTATLSNSDSELRLSNSTGETIKVAGANFDSNTPENFYAGIQLASDVDSSDFSVSADTFTVQDGGTAIGASQSNSTVNGVSVLTREDAGKAIQTIDFALDKVNGLRAELGAVQARFESTISNLASTSENLSAANSRILDADFAAETAKLSKSQVLQQAGISVLAQANARPQQVLSLLQ